MEIGVVLFRQLPVDALDLLRRSVLLHAQDLIIVLHTATDYSIGEGVTSGWHRVRAWRSGTAMQTSLPGSDAPHPDPPPRGGRDGWGWLLGGRPREATTASCLSPPPFSWSTLPGCWPGRPGPAGPTGRAPRPPALLRRSPWRLSGCRPSHCRTAEGGRQGCG